MKIYNLSMTYESIELKNRIGAYDQPSFGCVVKLDQNRYIALLVEKNALEVVINVIDSLRKTADADDSLVASKLSWIESSFGGGHTSFKIEHVACPFESSSANNSLLHAYVNACAANWSLQCKYWPFLKANFYRQEFATSRNIELLKMVVIQTDIILVENETASCGASDKSKCMLDFEEKFTAFYRDYLNGFGRLDTLGDLVEIQMDKIEQIETFSHLEEFINEISADVAKEDLLKQVDLLRDEGPSIDQIKIFLIRQVKLKSLESLELKERVVRLLEHFENTLHESLLHSILDQNKGKVK